MKYTLAAIRVAITLGLLTVVAPPAAAYYIRSMAVDIHVHADSSYTVQEAIQVDFQQEEHHGIFRDIRTALRDTYGNSRTLRIAVVGVTNGSGQAWPYAAYRTGNYYRIKIGSADSTVTGMQDYVITYNVENGLLYFPAQDELYWNATGNEWPVPIEQASCTVHLPGPPPTQKIQASCFIGQLGSTQPGWEQKIADGEDFRSPRPLNYKEGLTVAIGWPKGYVTPPSGWQKLWWFVTDNLFAFLPIIYLLGFIWLWRSTGRDPDAGVSETVRYEPPDSLRPAEVGTLIDESADMIDITSTIVDFAVRGYIKITEVPPEGMFGRRSYVLDKVKDRKREDPRGALLDYEQTIFDKLFSLGDSVNTEDLKNHFYSAIPTVRNQLYDSMLTHKYFRSRPDSVRDTYYMSGAALLIGGGVLAVSSFADLGVGGVMIAPGWGIAVALCGLITLGFARAMPRKTAIGRHAYLDALGFEEYLRRAERDAIHLQEKQGLFETFLPYAICLKVPDQWSKAFSGIYTTPPDWYDGGWGAGGFEPLLLASSLNLACGSMSSAMVTAPRSAGGGGGSVFGGGLGGGGFSGGGFGGGGGGAW